MGGRDADRSATPARRGPFAHLRAILVALHVVAITLMALPSPGEGLYRSAWQDPTVQGEFVTWSARLNQLGVSVTPAEFEDRLWVLAEGYTKLHNRLLAPFRLYYETCGTMQSWRMFAGPHRHPVRVEIEVEESGVWHTVFRQRDPAHAWLARELDTYRVRPILYRFGWYRYGGENEDLNGFARWVARRAAADFPRATRVRVRLYQQQTPSPEETRAGEKPYGQFVKDVTADVPR